MENKEKKCKDCGGMSQKYDGTFLCNCKCHMNQQTEELREWEEFEKIADKQIFLLNGKKGTLKNTLIYESIKSLFLQNFIPKSQLAQVIEEWLALNLRNDNKENWDKELSRFGLYLQDIKNKLIG